MLLKRLAFATVPSLITFATSPGFNNQSFTSG